MFEKPDMQRWRREPLDSSLAENLSSECSNVDLEDMRSNYLPRVKFASEYFLSSHLYHYLLLISRLLYLMTDLVERFLNSGNWLTTVIWLSNL